MMSASARPADIISTQARFKVRFYQHGKNGIWSRTFFTEEAAAEFAKGKVLYGKPARAEKVKP